MIKKKVLIVGGSRFSGKQLMLKLAEEGHDIIVINRGKVLLTYPSNVTHIRADRMDFPRMQEVLSDQSFDWVFDYIAWQGPETKQLISILKGKIERFIHISTGNYYYLEDTNPYFTQPIFENFAMGPITEETDAYSKGKRIIEQDLMEAYAQEQFPMTILRPTFIYGPNNYFERETYFFRRILAHRPVLLADPGKGYFDMIHAEDLADLCILAAKSSKAIGNAYNASCGEIISGETFVQLVDSWVNPPTPTKIHYYSEEHLQQTNWPSNHPLYPFPPTGVMFFSAQKAMNELGFSPRRLETGLKETFQWFQNQSVNPDKDLERWKLEDNVIAAIKNL